MRVKICGITNRDDALTAVECGADALGFNLWPGSRRFVATEELKSIASGLPDGVERVAVLVNPSLEEARQVAQSGYIDALQLHGEESAQFCAGLREAGVRFSKATSVVSQADSLDLSHYGTDTLVLDTASAQGFGGTGETFSWHDARRYIDANAGLKIWLAGGLAPENVAEAIRVARPFGVDVTTGVESVVRRKDRARMKAFIEIAHRA